MVDESLSSDELNEKVIEVFKYYDLPYKIQGDRIYYSTEADAELIYNYTSKAMDSVWYRTHIIEK